VIDIHSHYIPAIDDGAASFEESVAMLRMAASHGTTSIVATPHASLDYAFNPAYNAEQLGLLREAAGDVIGLYLGCDLHLTFDNIRDALDNPDKYTINGRCYLLVEFSDLLIFKNIDEIFDNFLRSDIIPVVTHPERNALLQQRLPQLRRWVEMGCLMQVTAGSLLGAWGGKAKKFSEDLLGEDLVHFIASDGHDTRRRPPGGTSWRSGGAPVVRRQSGRGVERGSAAAAGGSRRNGGTPQRMAFVVRTAVTRKRWRLSPVSCPTSRSARPEFGRAGACFPGGCWCWRSPCPSPWDWPRACAGFSSPSRPPALRCSGLA
jgi:protein-tyrosine phosphatase